MGVLGGLGAIIVFLVLNKSKKDKKPIFDPTAMMKLLNKEAALKKRKEQERAKIKKMDRDALITDIRKRI